VKLLLDMGLGQSTAEYLRGQGHDVTHLREEGLQRLPDEEIIKKARREGRVILTHDLDFGRLIALSQSRLPSVVTLRLDDMRPTQVNHYLTETLARFGEELETGALVSVNEQAIRARFLPIE
jgi:predicted nuclease of predicted toxin-antitoxin system